MYCSSCGVAVPQGLFFCNHCGAKLIGENRDDVGKSSELRPGSLVWAMVVVLVFGFVAIVFLMMAMKVVGLNVGQILAFTILSFLLMLLVEGVFTWQLVRRKRGAERPGTALSNEQSTNELDEARLPLLEPRPSVTERTTRTFEPIYNERNPK